MNASTEAPQREDNFNASITGETITGGTTIGGMSYMFWGASSFNQDLCSWQDTFVYNRAAEIFYNSGCTINNQPREFQKGPFCASDCGIWD